MMRRILIALMVVLGIALVGCGAAGSGTYETEIAAGPMKMEGQIVLESGGTLTSTTKVMGVEHTTKGTWSLDGETLSVETTHEGGKKLDEPQKATATLKDGKITQRAGPLTMTYFKK
jgi:hypothetical protein